MQGGHRLLSTQLGDRLRPARVPRGDIRQPDVPDLAGPHQIVERAHDFLHGSQHVPGVHEIEIDVVGSESAQRAFERAQNVLAAIASGIRVVGLGAEAEFGGDHDLVPQIALANELTDPGFADPVGVEVSGIDEIAATVDVPIEDLPGRVLVGSPTPVGAEGHRAQGEAADAQSGVAQSEISGRAHDGFPPFRGLLLTWTYCARIGSTEKWV